jgi:hypothetical protein
MQKTTERPNPYQSQLDLILGRCRAGFACCEKVAEINTATARKLLAQVDESLSRGDLAEFVTTSGKIAAAHWTVTVSCGLEFQRQFLAGLVQK